MQPTLRRVALPLTTVLLLIGSGPSVLRAAEAEPADGIALAIVYDTSGSMRDAVQTADGSRAAKYIIANRALAQIVTRIEQFATNTASPRTVHGGLYIFRGTDVHEAVPMGPFDAGKFRDWLKSYRGPNSGTPLGTAVDVASRAVLNSKLSQKHVLVVTDGRNTAGPDPEAVIPRVQKGAERRKTTVFVHFVAFDIEAKVFAPLKKMGVNVVGAVDEKQLNQQLGFILEEKILLEKETK
jgi:hypothetical protein